MLLMETTDLINVLEAPPIPGLQFRGFRGELDYPWMAEVIAGCKHTDQDERTDTPEDIARAYAHLVNCDPYRDMLFATVDGQVVGYSRLTWREVLNGERIYEQIAFLLPTWRRQGIGRAMLRYNQHRLREIAAEHPDSEYRAFEHTISEAEVGARALLLDEGYHPVRYFYNMVRPDLEQIPEATMPPGLEVRPVEPEHYQAICDANKEAFRDHWGYCEEMEPTVEEWLDDPGFDPSLWRVAWDGDQVAGMVRSFIHAEENQEYQRKRGWTEYISVRRPWRRRGLARSLLVQSLYAIKARGMTEAALGVDVDNPNGALRLYESVGFRPVKRWTAYQKTFRI